MTLDEATRLIASTADAMSRAYGRTVFDEFAIVARVGAKIFLVWYSGPRKETFQKTFHQDTAALRAEAQAWGTDRYHVGDFEFTPQGAGAQSEAFVVVGKELILVCTNTAMSMAEISKDRRWLEAQRPFVEMSERFRTDPLFVKSPPGPELAVS